MTPTPNPHPDDASDGTRSATASRGRAPAWMLGATAVAVVGGLALWRLTTPDAVAVAGDAPASAAATQAPAARAGYAATAMAAVGKTRPLPGDDRDDVAAYFHPGDAEPTGAELIEAMQASGVHTGIGAFNPPGTRPPLEGLAVPEDFELPEGYVRHHQTTDAGDPIEPILMFAPDFVLTDARGAPVAMPEDRVVTAELAPPGLPLRNVRIAGL